MKIPGGTEVRLYTVLTSPPDGCDWVKFMPLLLFRTSVITNSDILLQLRKRYVYSYG
jgi:hypothetical protein